MCAVLLAVGKDNDKFAGVGCINVVIAANAGVGGSMLSIGSAAGVALMGQAGGKYTFFGHLKWTPVILLGYAAGIMVHMRVNAETFNIPIVTG